MKSRHWKITIAISVVAIGAIIASYHYVRYTDDRFDISTGQADAVVYTQNGSPVMATVVINKDTSTGISKQYACGIDLESGKQLWHVRLETKKDDDSKREHAVILGHSAKYLFFLYEDLYVINKETGNVAFKNKEIDSPGKTAKSPSYDYVLNAMNNYRYNTKTQTILNKRADGKIHVVDGNTLKEDVLQSSAFYESSRHMPADLEKERTRNFDLLRITYLHTETQTYGFLTDRDMKRLEKGDTIYGSKYGTPEVGTASSLYAAATDTSLKTLKKLNYNTYHYGGFLGKFLAGDPGLSYCFYQPYMRGTLYPVQYRGTDSRAGVYNLPQGGYIILYREQEDNDAPVQLSAVSPDGKAYWHVNTGLKDVYITEQENTDHFLIMGPVEKDTYAVSTVIYLSAKDGETWRYQFHKQ